MMKRPPPLAAALELALASDALRLADEALGVAWDALAEIKVEDQGPIDCFDLQGFRETCKLLVEIFAPAKKAFGLRGSVLPLMWAVIRESIEGLAESPGNLPGLERAGLAVQFANASVEDAADALDEWPGGDAWYGPCCAAQTMLGMIRAAIEGAVVNNPDQRGEWFGRN